MAAREHRNSNPMAGTKDRNTGGTWYVPGPAISFGYCGFLLERNANHLT